MGRTYRKRTFPEGELHHHKIRLKRATKTDKETHLSITMKTLLLIFHKIRMRTKRTVPNGDLHYKMQTKRTDDWETTFDKIRMRTKRTVPNGDLHYKMQTKRTD